MARFSAAVLRVQKARGQTRVLAPEVLLRSWSSFVDDCVAGYEMNYDEYLGDLSVRRIIEACLNDAELQRIDGYDAFRDDVRVTDERFRSIAAEGVLVGAADAPWWERLLPDRGGAELAEDVRAIHGLTITTVA